MNQISLIGRLTNAPEVSYSQSNKAIARYCLAVPKVKNGEKGVDFIQCVSFGKTAESIGNFLTKGRQVGVTGRLDTGKYTAGDGNTRYYAQVVALNVTFGAKPNPPQEADLNAFSDDEIPF